MGGSHSCQRRGAVLVMVTLSLFVMFGMLGLVVDLGWAYFTKKSAQTAADAAALVAVKMVKNNAGSISDYSCGDNARCSATPLLCADVVDGNLKAACDFAALNGFTDSREGRQTVTVQASDSTQSPTVSEACGQEGATVHHPPTTGCVDTYYWVTVRVSESIPQLFSAILGNREATASARATAAVAQSEVYGALILINRENEQWIEDAGINLYVGGTPNVKVPGGILLASSAHGPQVQQDPWAGFISGSGIVDTLTGTTYFRAGGNYAISGGGEWLGAKSSSGASFDDPMSGRGQPPLTERALAAKPVPGGNLTAAYCGGDCTSGNYYAVGPDPGCATCPFAATGEPITIGSDVTFRDGGFGDFYFYGGLKIGQATVNFGPGRYGLFGVKDPERTLLWDNENRAQLLSTSESDRGRLFILSDTSYDGLDTQLATITEKKIWSGGGNTLSFSKAAVKAGNNDSSRVELYGLDHEANRGTELEQFSPALIWQDQRNSYVGYTKPEGNVAVCGDGGLNSPCPGGASYPSTSPQLEIWATPYAEMVGLIYQPRGAWTLLQAAGDYTGPLRIISGAMKLQGSGRLTLTGDSPPVINYITALVE